MRPSLQELVFGKPSDDPARDFQPGFWRNYRRPLILCAVGFVGSLAAVLWFVLSGPHGIFSGPLGQLQFGEGVGVFVFAALLLPLCGAVPLFLYRRYQRLLRVMRAAADDVPDPGDGSQP